MREGGGEPGEPPKQMKKEKGPFQKKETATLAAPSKIFQKKQKRLITTMEKRSNFEF